MSGSVHYQLGSFPPSNIDWERLVPLIGQANAALARYDGLIDGAPNPNLLLSPLRTQEAVLSSKIEGTTVSMREVLEIEAGLEDNFAQAKRDDAEEVRNYDNALSFVSQELVERERPFSFHLVRQAHELLMKGVRGHDKKPGSLREQQNWIGRPGSTIEQASFVPIPQEHLQAGVDVWLEYIDSPGQPDPLVQLAIIHAEFEALHPFMDGNGRLGRMIIPMFLFKQGLLTTPSFYMSGYLEANREHYIEALRAVSRDGAWTEWCEFFLQGLTEQAVSNQAKAQAINSLHKRMLREVPEITNSKFSNIAIEFIFSNPVFPTSQFIRETGLKTRTVTDILQALRSGENPVLQTTSDSAGSKPAVLEFLNL